MSGRNTKIALQPKVLRWARARSGLEVENLARKIGVKPDRVHEWEESGQITLAQVDKLAHHTHTPVGYLYLPEPVDDRLPISDFRTAGVRQLSQPSPELLDTVQIMQRRQSWMRDELIEAGNRPLGFVGSIDLDVKPEVVAAAMREQLGLDFHWAYAERTWTDALRRLRTQIEAAGILVIFNGIVANNTHRKLNPSEFRGFALVDEYVPLIFINNADFKSAQMFTLVHELVHVWVGAEGVSNFGEPLTPPPNRTEQFCNKAAAEFLVPEDELLSVWNQAPEEDRYDFLARTFKVSTLVAARRALDLKLINRDAFFEFYHAWEEDERREARSGEGGGDFWNNQNYRIGKPLGFAVVQAVKEGRLLYRDAYSLTGLKGETFSKFAELLGDGT
jgi:Zn-dependent peptidase ImmA (M78 family)